jgi:hypothetical protein
MLVVNGCSLLYALLSRLVAGVVYVEVSHQKQTTPRSRFFAVLPDVLLSIVVVAGISVVSALLAQPHHYSVVSTCLGSSANIAVSECEAFGTFHDSTGGYNWHECSGARDNPCDCATRVTCVGGHIVGLDMSGNNLEGVVPGRALSQLLQLTSLRLDNNPQQYTSSSNGYGMHGSIPNELSLLTKLVRLNLSTTELVGDLAIFSTLTQLWSLDLSTCGWGDETGFACASSFDPNDDSTAYTYISGPLDALSPLTQLREIHLNGTRWRQRVPFKYHLNRITGSASVLAHLTHLTSLNIANAGYNDNTSLCNQVTGEMPLWMLRDHERMAINVADNLVTLPYDLGKLHTSEPSSLDLTGLGLIGPLPTSLGELTSLRRLNLSCNGFSGSIGPLSTLTQLTSLDVSGGSSGFNHNNFSGELPLWMLRKSLIGRMELRLQGDDGSGNFDSNHILLPHDIGSSTARRSRRNF